MDGVKTQEEQNRLTENHERYTLRGLSENNGVPNRTMTRKAVTIKGAQERVDTATSSSEVRPACMMHPVVVYPGTYVLYECKQTLMRTHKGNSVFYRNVHIGYFSQRK